MNKLLIICGPTATGKTNLGIHLAKKFNGEIVSADSRQVYKGMDIGTGKDVSDFDLPAGKAGFRISDLSWQGKKLGNYQKAGAKIWGYDLVEPDQDFSIAQYKRAADKIIADIVSRSKLPIIVGGTGLYVKALTQPLETISIKPNNKLRQQLDKLSLIQLQIKLNKLDPGKFSSMNHSDQQNPRRLIRAIEVASVSHSGAKQSGAIESKPHENRSYQSLRSFQDDKYDTLWIGLKTDLNIIDQRIEQRVKQRLESGMIKEVKKLTAYNLDWNSNPATATGYKQIRDLINNKITKNQAINLWATAEKQYARRQLSWFKKQPSINWFDISATSWQTQVDHLVQPWYD